MNFLIFRDFSEFIFDLNLLKTIKKRLKGGLFLCGTHMGATWHAWPRGRVPTWHEGDTWAIFIFTRII